MFKKMWALSCTLLIMSCSADPANVESGEIVVDNSHSEETSVEDSLPGSDNSQFGEDNIFDPFGDIFKPIDWVGNTPVRWSTCGTRGGEHPCNLVLLDQNGEEFELYEHYGKSIVVDFSAGWCGPCRRAADVVQEHADAFAPQGLLYITVLIETSTGQVPTVTDAQEWADDHNITSAPVLTGSRALLESSGGDWTLTGWPTFYFIKRDMTMHLTMRGWSEEMLVGFIEEILE